MARYNPTELKQLYNPYQNLIASANGLLENQDSLQALTLEEKLDLITRLVFSCAGDLRRIERLVTYKSLVPCSSQIDEEDFFLLLDRGLQVEKQIRYLSDPANQSAHIFFVGMADVDPTTLTMCTEDEKLALAINCQPFMQFAPLTTALIKKDAQVIARHLAVCTSPEYVDIVFRVTEHTCPKPFLTALHNAFFNPNNEGFTFHERYQQFGLMRAVTETTSSVVAKVNPCQIL